MTAPTLRVLVLDDNPHDRQLTLRQLRKQFPDVEAIEPLDDAGFRDALANETFDVVVTDFNLKWASGMDIVRAVKEARPHCPVIMFTATGTQEVAVEAMKAGLDDYVIKSPKHYVRLAVAVRSCLDRAEIRLRALRSETRLHTLLERLNVGVLRTTVEGDVVDANRAEKITALGAFAICVLIVDDNVDAATSLSYVLALAGYQTALAHDGKRALELAEKLHPAVVLLDIGLPSMSGHEVARRLRAAPGVRTCG